MKKIVLGTFNLAALMACQGAAEKEAASTDSHADYAATLQEQLLDAQSGDVIEIPAGRFTFDRSLSLTVDGVTIRGAGMDETVLSFKGQIAGAEGLLVTASDFTLEGLTIQDTKGDALKVNEGKNITIRGIKTEWTGGHKTSNGAYGIYPVQCENVLIEDSVAIAASDAGIYVGQSENIIVRRNRAEYNVAGIEIENSVHADVYDNVAIHNTGGILVFNMPNLPRPGHSTRVYDNTIVENNTKNFGHAGTPVASVPAGSGIVINSNDKVEIFGNNIRDNKTANIIISSIHMAGFEGLSTQDDFDGYPEGIYIYDNTLEGGGNSPDGLDLKALKVAKFGLSGSLPDILWDGFQDSEKFVDGKIVDEHRICVDNGDIQILNADAPNGFGNPDVVDMSAHSCELEKLKPVKFSG